jgi:DNA adenine methylase
MSVKANHGFTSPLRYPGGKGALANFMKLVISKNNLFDGEYVEIYAGGAGIAWSLLFEEYVHQVHINDLNSHLMAFWRSVIESTEEICRLIHDTPVTMDQWFRQREIQNNPQNYCELEIGFSTFFLNRTNRSGILKGGVIGGKGQAGKWKIDARFNKKDLISRIKNIGRYSNRIKLYNIDAVEFIKTVLPCVSKKALVYLDPPYYNKGQELYENHYVKQDHAEIAHLVLSKIIHPWIVSYDLTPEIIELYGQNSGIRYGINYSAQERYTGSEVIFYSSNIKIPLVQNPTTIKLLKTELSK